MGPRPTSPQGRESLHCLRLQLPVPQSPLLKAQCRQVGPSKRPAAALCCFLVTKYRACSVRNQSSSPQNQATKTTATLTEGGEVGREQACEKLAYPPTSLPHDQVLESLGAAPRQAAEGLSQGLRDLEGLTPAGSLDHFPTKTQIWGRGKPRTWPRFVAGGWQSRTRKFYALSSPTFFFW